jgi:type II secretory pathway pseudopilin PulG
MNKPSLRAFSMIEALVVVTVVAILAALVTPWLSNANAKAMRIRCVGHLKNVGLAHRIFATDNGDLFPWERSLAEATNQMNFPDLTGLSADQQVVQIYRSLSNELSTPKIIVCPADIRNAANDWQKLSTNNISYFVGLSARETLYQTMMASDQNLVLDGKELSGRVELKSDAPVAWDKNIHKFQGSVTMGDGSVQQVSSG